MVGNDVVDLRDRDADPATLGARFDQRVFCEAERLRLAASPDSARERWRLWAAKEAAYKLTRKLDPATVFSPSGFVVEWTGMRSPRERVGVVRHGERELMLRLCEGPDYVHAVTRPPCEGTKLPLTGLRRLMQRELEEHGRSAPSIAVRRFCIDALAAELGLEARDLEVRRHGRVPHVYWRGHSLPGADLSLSHHGSFVAFAFIRAGTEVAA